MAGRKGASRDARDKQQPNPLDSAGDVYALNSQIIALLQQDGRMPYSTIATALGVSEGTVRNRVRQLIDENIITIQAEAMPEAFGYNFNAQTFIKVAGGADIDAVIARLSVVPEVFYLTSTLGRFDLGMATYHQSHEHYRLFLAAHCYGQPDIALIETCMVLKVHKMKLQWNLEGEPRPSLRGKEHS